MKKLFLLFAMTFAMGFTACSNEDFPVNPEEQEEDPKDEPQFYVYLCSYGSC